MKSCSIDFEKLASKYMAELSPDDTVVDAAAVTAVHYKYRGDYQRGQRVLITIFLALFFLFTISISVLLYILLMTALLVITELICRSTCKKPDMIQFFFLSKNRLFVRNKNTEKIIPFNEILKVTRGKYIGKNKEVAVIDVYHITGAFSVYAGAEDADRLYQKLCLVCKGVKENGI